VQPKVDVFEKENEEIKQQLETAVSPKADSPDHRPLPTLASQTSGSPPAAASRSTARSAEVRQRRQPPLTTVGLYWRTQWTKWNDWNAVRLVTGGKLEKVDVVSIKRRKRIVKALITAILGGTIYYHRDAVASAWSEIVASVPIKAW
jgi:hypothetical protein